MRGFNRKVFATNWIADADPTNVRDIAHKAPLSRIHQLQCGSQSTPRGTRDRRNLPLDSRLPGAVQARPWAYSLLGERVSSRAVAPSQPHAVLHLSSLWPH